MSRAYAIINPEIIMPGEQDFVEGVDFFVTFSRVMKGILISNTGITGIKTIVQKSYHIENDKHITFSGYMEPDLVAETEGLLKLSDQFIYSSEELSDTDFNILIFHGTEEYLKQNSDYFSSYNLILSAHQQTAIIDTLNKPFHVNAWADGEVLHEITILNLNDSYKIKVQTQNILKAEKPNQEIRKLIEDYNVMIENL